MTIGDSERRLLRECVVRQAPELAPILTKTDVERLSDKERESLRSAVAAELCDTGLAPTGGHNQRGVTLDDLIDVLGHY